MGTVDPGQMIPQLGAAMLHRTPVHTELLAKVDRLLVEWRPAAGPRGGFGRIGGLAFGHDEQAALYELELAGLIRRGELSGVVLVTSAGAGRLAEWTVFRG